MNAVRTIFLLLLTLLFSDNIKTMYSCKEEKMLYLDEIPKNPTQSSLESINPLESTPSLLRPLSSSITVTTEKIPSQLNTTTDLHTNSDQTTSGGSWLGTTWYYGLAKTIGKTKTQVFLELDNNDMLKVDAKSNPAEVIRRLTDATEERFKERSLLDTNNQYKIFQILARTETLKKDSGKDIQVPKVLAEEYNKVQKAALMKIIENHATIKQPELAYARDIAITRSYKTYHERKAELNRIKQSEIQLAHQIYSAEMGTLRDFEGNAAFNSRYVHACAQDPEKFPLHDSTHYQNLYSQTANYKQTRYDIKKQRELSSSSSASSSPSESASSSSSAIRIQKIKKEPKSSIQKAILQEGNKKNKQKRKEHLQKQIIASWLDKHKEQLPQELLSEWIAKKQLQNHLNTSKK